MFQNAFVCFSVVNYVCSFVCISIKVHVGENIEMHMCVSYLGMQHCFTHKHFLCHKQESYSKVVEYYGENARSISPANFFAQIVRFVNAFKVSEVSCKLYFS